MDAGASQLTGCRSCMEANKTEVENRVIFVTGGWVRAMTEQCSGHKKAAACCRLAPTAVEKLTC